MIPFKIPPGKRRAKKGKAGRPAGCIKGDAAPSPSKRQKVSPGPVASTMASQMNTSPGPITRSQMHGGINQINTSPRVVTRSQNGEGASQISTSPGPVTRSQSLLTMVELGGTNQITMSSGPVTASQIGEVALDNVITPTKSPAKRRLGLKKKLTPRKGRNNAAWIIQEQLYGLFCVLRPLLCSKFPGKLLFTWMFFWI